MSAEATESAEELEKRRNNCSNAALRAAKRLEELRKLQPLDPIVSEDSSQEDLDKCLANLIKEKKYGFYGEELPPIVAAIRKHDWKPHQKIKMIEHILSKDPKALQAESLRFHNKDHSTLDYFSYSTKKTGTKNPKLAHFITSPLHEAIFECEPLLVEFLCKKGAKVNFNPRSQNQLPKQGYTYTLEELFKITEYSYSPLDLALQPVSPLSSRHLFYYPEIIQILLQFGAKLSDGTTPQPISQQEIQETIKYLSELLNKYFNEAKSSDKKLILLLPEYHSSRHCLLKSLMILYCAAKLGIRRFYMEEPGKNPVEKGKYQIWSYSEFMRIHDYMNKVQFSNKEFLTVKTTLLASQALKMLPTPVDLSDTRHKQTTSKNIEPRNKVMKECIEEIDESGVWIVGEAHLPGLLYHFPLDPNRFLVCPINVCPESISSYCKYKGGLTELIHLPLKWQGWAEMMTEEEMLRAICPEDIQFQTAVSSIVIGSALKKDFESALKEWYETEEKQETALNTISNTIAQYYTPLMESKASFQAAAFESPQDKKSNSLSL